MLKEAEIYDVSQKHFWSDLHTYFKYLLFRWKYALVVSLLRSIYLAF